MRFCIKPVISHIEANGDSKPLDRALHLLGEIEASGNLREASRQLGISYRHAWNLLADLDALLGDSVVEMTRGRGSRLTELGRKLLWAHRQMQARLGPFLDSMASEIEAEINSIVPQGDGALRLFASHGFAIDALRKRLTQRKNQFEINYRGSLEAVDALNRGVCDIAGFHIPQGPLMEPVLARFANLFKPSFRLLCLATRGQGIMVAPGNPHGIWSIADLKKPHIRLVNRQENSGTRMLLELLLEQHQIDKREIQGFESVEFTHSAVAAYIASRKADVGIGVEAAARQFNLDFVPLLTENYFLMFDQSLQHDSRLRPILETLESGEFRAEVSGLSGYAPCLSLDMPSPATVFPGLV